MRAGSRNELNIVERRPELYQTLKILEGAFLDIGRLLLRQSVFPFRGVFPICKIQRVPVYLVNARVRMPQNADGSSPFPSAVHGYFQISFSVRVSVRALESAIEAHQILVIVVEAQHPAVPVRTIINVHNISRVQVDTDSDFPHEGVVVRCPL